jgi:hypothetical protein
LNQSSTSIEKMLCGTADGLPASMYRRPHRTSTVSRGAPSSSLAGIADPTHLGAGNGID